MEINSLDFVLYFAGTMAFVVLVVLVCVFAMRRHELRRQQLRLLNLENGPMVKHVKDRRHNPLSVIPQPPPQAHLVDDYPFKQPPPSTHYMHSPSSCAMGEFK
ncbi:hypothetical protein DSO57_1010123 [Entomophthora muscae]|uniref:Uncharacterized protein n=1 Tax=Entomophthora muscae TaxID=34485 RepID=A0ACC2SW20_9FUNG|nr:hypothetical protein DSO57_1010123 [Entomophthora muscae]